MHCLEGIADDIQRVMVHEKVSRIETIAKRRRYEKGRLEIRAAWQPRITLLCLPCDSAWACVANNWVVLSYQRWQACRDRGMTSSDGPEETTCLAVKELQYYQVSE